MGSTAGIVTSPIGTGGRVVKAGGTEVAPANDCCPNCCLGPQYYSVVISGVSLASGAIPELSGSGSCSVFTVSGTINGTYCLTQTSAGSNQYTGSVPITITYNCPGLSSPLVSSGTLTTSVPITLQIDAIFPGVYDGGGQISIGGNYGSNPNTVIIGGVSYATSPFYPSGVSFAFFTAYSTGPTFCGGNEYGYPLPCPPNTLQNLYTSTSSPGGGPGCPWADGCCNSSTVIVGGWGGQMVVTAMCSC